MKDQNTQLIRCLAELSQSEIKSGSLLSRRNGGKLQTLRVEEIWLELLSIYGQRFVDMWLNVDHQHAKKVWAMALDRFSDADLLHAIDACLSFAWPPTLPEFIALIEKRTYPENPSFEPRKNRI